MAGRNRDRQRRQRQQVAAQAALEAQRAVSRRRRVIFGSALAGVAALVIGLVLLTRDDNGKSTLKTRPTTTVQEVPPKPCVAVADPLPAGAPAIPVKTGPPPAQLIREDLKTGTGAVVGPGDTVTANYIGVACSTGKIFDSSYSRGEAATFPLNNVIKGWQVGIPGMKVGGQRLLGIPADQAYGAEGRPPTIGPSEALWFVVEIVDTKATAAPPQ